MAQETDKKEFSNTENLSKNSSANVQNSINLSISSESAKKSPKKAVNSVPVVQRRAVTYAARMRDIIAKQSAVLAAQRK